MILIDELDIMCLARVFGQRVVWYRNAWGFLCCLDALYCLLTFVRGTPGSIVLFSKSGFIHLRSCSQNNSATMAASVYGMPTAESILPSILIHIILGFCIATTNHEVGITFSRLHKSLC